MQLLALLLGLLVAQRGGDIPQLPLPQVWNLKLQFATNPTLPQPETGRKLSESIRLDYVRGYWFGPPKSSLDRDTTRLSWDPSAKRYTEEHFYSERPDYLGSATRLSIFGLDTAVAARGGIYCDSSRYEFRDSSGWAIWEHLTSRDSAGLRVSEVTTFNGASRFEWHIIETRDAAGFVVRVDSLLKGNDGKWRLYRRHVVTRESDGRPLEDRDWEADNTGLVPGGRETFKWDGPRMTEDVEYLANGDTLEAHRLEWSATGKLVAWIGIGSETATWKYDSLDRVVVYHRGTDNDSFDYDEAGRVARRRSLWVAADSSNSSLSTLAFSFDPSGRVTHAIFREGDPRVAPVKWTDYGEDFFTYLDATSDVYKASPSNQRPHPIWDGHHLSAVGADGAEVRLDLALPDGTRVFGGRGTERVESGDLSAMKRRLVLWNLRSGTESGSGQILLP